MPRPMKPASQRGTQLAVSVPVETAERLIALSALRGGTVSDLLREGIAMVLAQGEGGAR
jgi:predicted DNA-binding protein